MKDMYIRWHGFDSYAHADVHYMPRFFPREYTLIADLCLTWVQRSSDIVEVAGPVCCGWGTGRGSVSTKWRTTGNGVQIRRVSLYTKLALCTKGKVRSII